MQKETQPGLVVFFTQFTATNLCLNRRKLDWKLDIDF